MTITLHRLSDIPAENWLHLVNHPDVIRHMPLSTGWTASSIARWVKDKDEQWEINGYGPWAVRINGQFAGWGGFQKEGNEADLALVLLPHYWGQGVAVFRLFLARRAALGIGPFTVLLPPSRSSMKGLLRLGFIPDGEVEYDGHRFLKFRQG
jgi:RimJ/RimL family protein N-acetyltransferase